MKSELNLCKDCSWHNNHFLNTQEDKNYCNKLQGLIVDGDEYACSLFERYPLPIIENEEGSK